MDQMKHMTYVWDDESMTPIAFFDSGGMNLFQHFIIHMIHSRIDSKSLKLNSPRYGII